MRHAEVRQQVSDTLRKIGHKPKVQGGNGRGMTEAQSILLEALHSAGMTGFTPEYIQPTGTRHFYPTHYKIDIADKSSMTAVEIDGFSHAALERRAQDKKKDSFLTSLGWKVLRLSNKQVMEHLEACVLMVSSTTLK